MVLPFKTQFNFDPSLAEEVMDQTLVTEPGLSMDVPTMLRRYAQGTLQGLSVRYPQFDDLDEPDPTESPDWDITDAEEYLRSFGVRQLQQQQQRSSSPAGTLQQDQEGGEQK